MLAHSDLSRASLAKQCWIEAGLESGSGTCLQHCPLPAQSSKQLCATVSHPPTRCPQGCRVPSEQLPAGSSGGGMAVQVRGPSTAAQGAVSRKWHPARKNEVSAISHILMGLNAVLLLAVPEQPVCDPKGWCGDDAPCCVGLAMCCLRDGCSYRAALWWLLCVRPQSVHTPVPLLIITR